MRKNAFWGIFALLVSFALMSGCCPYATCPVTHQPQAAPAAAPPPEPEPEEPACSPWPQLTLIGPNGTKVALVFSEFVDNGWAAGRITRVTGEGRRNHVKAAAGGQSILIPTSRRVLHRGLCTQQREMIRQFTLHHRPAKACKTHPTETRTWLHARGWLSEPKAWRTTRAWPNGRTWLDSIEGPFIEEFRTTEGWRYRHGLKSGNRIRFTECLESPARKELTQLPWGGGWTLVMNNFEGEPKLGQTMRVWYQRT